LTEHVNRFGSHTLDMKRSAPAPYYNLSLRVSGQAAQKGIAHFIYDVAGRVKEARDWRPAGRQEVDRRSEEIARL